MHRLIVFALALVAHFCVSAAAATTTIFDDIRFRRVSVDEGLSQSTVRAMAQDRQGFVWVGTIDGLNRLDGHAIRVYRQNPNDERSLPENHVSAMAVTPSGQVWFGTMGGGIASYDARFDRFERMSLNTDGKSPQADSVAVMASDRDGRVWIASAAGQLRRLDPVARSIEVVELALGDALRAIRDLIVMNDGRVILATRDGVFELSADLKTTRELHGETASIDAFCLAEGAKRNLFVGTADEGLVEFNSVGQLRRWTEADGLSSNAVRRISVDGSGRVWIGTNSGLSQLDVRQERIRSWTHDPIGRSGLGGHRVESMMIDRDGLVWVGTWANGISIHDPQTEAFQTFKYRPDNPAFLDRPTVTALAMTRAGELIVGMHEEGGAARVDLTRGVTERFLHDPKDPKSLGASSISSVLETRDGSIWLATQTAGLSRLRPGSRQFQSYRWQPDQPGTLSSNNVADLFEDHVGNLWVATIGGGVNRLCSTCDQFEQFREQGDSALSSNYANALYETRDGAIWIGYRTVGLDRMDVVSGQVTRFRAGAGAGALSSNAVTFIFEDRAENLWVATQGGGLNRGRRRGNGVYEFVAIRRVDGLGSDMVSALAEDESGAIWAATSVGISRVSPTDSSIVNYGWSEGAQSRGYFVGSVTRGGGNELYFGGLEGITRFDASKVGEPRPPRRPVVSSMTTFNRERSRFESQSTTGYRLGDDGDIDAVELKHDDDIVHFEFATFSFANPESVRYAYRLDGFDSNWVSLEHSGNRATFTDLPAGDYRLHVRAAGPRSQRWIEMERPLGVRVSPAPWWNAWAIATYLLLLGALIAWLAHTIWHAVSQRLAAQRRLKESEERLALALEASGDEIWEANFETLQFVRFTPHIPVKLPNNAEPLPMADLRRIVHADDLPLFDGAIREVAKGIKDQMRATYRLGLENGGWIWVQSYGRVVERNVEGRAVRLAGVSRDVSEIMSQDEALQRINQDLERRVEARTRDFQVANEHLRRTLDDLRNAQKQLVESEKMAALGGLVAGVAHEINTPLGIGVTAASHLETETKRIQDQISQNALKRSDLDVYVGIANESSQLILRNLRRADHLIKSFKQVAVDQSSEHRRLINLREYLDEILTSLQPRLKKTRYQVQVECPGDLSVDTFPGALYQILVNLVMNSIIHGFEGRDTGVIRIDASNQDGRVQLLYADDGNGMAPEVAQRIFEPFFTTKRGQGGSGLGMHIVYNLVTQLLDGTVRCESEKGRGVRFTINFPARHTAANSE